MLSGCYAIWRRLSLCKRRTPPPNERSQEWGLACTPTERMSDHRLRSFAFFQRLYLQNAQESQRGLQRQMFIASRTGMQLSYPITNCGVRVGYSSGKLCRISFQQGELISLLPCGWRYALGGHVLRPRFENVRLELPGESALNEYLKGGQSAPVNNYRGGERRSWDQ